jgi:hypothetical protein
MTPAWPGCFAAAWLQDAKANYSALMRSGDRKLQMMGSAAQQSKAMPQKP